MESHQIHELLNLLIRWFHVIVGITWIGQIYLFNWMEKTLPKEIDSQAGKNVVGQLWMVHGGGFYFVEKQKIPQVIPRTLHWFKWETAHLDQRYVSANHCLLHGWGYVRGRFRNG